MRVMNHNWSATKQHLYPQSVAEISHHFLLQAPQFSLFCVKTVQQRPLLLREVETWLLDCGVAH